MQRSTTYTTFTTIGLPRQFMLPCGPEVVSSLVSCPGSSFTDVLDAAARVLSPITRTVLITLVATLPAGGGPHQHHPHEEDEEIDASSPLIIRLFTEENPWLKLRPE